MKRPFPVEQALANSGSGLPVIMREKEALAGRFTAQTEIIGSGPFRFVPSAYKPGDHIIYERFSGYVPRTEPANGLAGGKIAKVDKLDFHFIPDAATKSAALTTGEVDIVDQLPFDQGPTSWSTARTSSSSFPPAFSIRSSCGRIRCTRRSIMPGRGRRWHWR